MACVMDLEELEKHNQLFQVGEPTDSTRRPLTGDEATVSALLDLNWEHDAGWHDQSVYLQDACHDRPV
jgi:hypothetical protein